MAMLDVALLFLPSPFFSVLLIYCIEVKARDAM